MEGIGDALAVVERRGNDNPGLDIAEGWGIHSLDGDLRPDGGPLPAEGLANRVLIRGAASAFPTGPVMFMPILDA